jgi:hypothetical protein
MPSVDAAYLDQGEARVDPKLCRDPGPVEIKATARDLDPAVAETRTVGLR